MEAHAKKRFQDYNEDVIQAKFALGHIYAIVTAISALLGIFMQVGTIFLSAYLIIQGHLTAGTLIGLVQVSGQITGPIQELSECMPKIQGTKEIIERLEGFMASVSSLRENQVATFKDEIKVEKLEFTYPDQVEPAFKQLELLLRKIKNMFL